MEINQTIWLNISKYDLLGAVCVLRQIQYSSHQQSAQIATGFHLCAIKSIVARGEKKKQIMKRRKIRHKYRPIISMVAGGFFEW